VFWELLTMRRLFKRDTEMLTLEAIMHGNIPRPSRFREDLPKSIDEVAMKALARDKRDRFADCEQLALALEDALATEGIVHSQARLAQYMRRLFADTLAEEATLGLVNPDGSLSKNLTPFTLPPPEKDEPAQTEHVQRKEKDAPPKVEAEEPAAQVDATMADRKSARSSHDTQSRGTKKKPPEPKSIPTESGDLATDPTVVDGKKGKERAPEPPPPKPRDRGRDRDDDRDRDRDRAPIERDRGPRRPPWSIIGAGVAAAVIVVVGWLGYDAWSHSGNANLIVRSEPRGARVILDGEDTGQPTPALLREVPVGKPHKVRLEQNGKFVEEVVTIPRRGATLRCVLDTATCTLSPD
jgi:hypothetical protein